jgi:hypothetical protein
MDVNQMLADAVKLSIPAMKTQAQINAFFVAFDAFRLHVNAICDQNGEHIEVTRKALQDSFELLHKATAISKVVAEVPDAAKRVDASFSEEPVQFNEMTVHGELLRELAAIVEPAKLQQWYGASRDRFDRIVSQELRNSLFDAIRDRRVELSKTV